MAETVPIVTQGVPRELLAQFVGNHRVIRLLESITQDLTANIPDFLNATAATLGEASDLAQTALSLAAVAQAIAQQALATGQQAGDGPPPTPVVIPDIPDDLTAAVSELRARLATLERAVAELSERPTP